MDSFPIEDVIDVSRVALRIGSSPGASLVYLQFFFEDANTEEERRYTIRISADQMRLIAQTYPRVQDEVDLFASLEGEFEDS